MFRIFKKIEIMKVLSVKQPWASLICSGIKDIENRTWKTKFRGRVLIHAGATKTNEFWMHDSGVIKDYWRGVGSYVGIPDNEMCECLRNKCPQIFSAIIGSIEIVDCVLNHESIWAEKTEGTLVGNRFYTKDGVKPIYNWVLANAILFPEPIPTKGKLSFWDYPDILAEPEEKGSELFCHCQLHVKEINQVTGSCSDYRCIYCGGKWYK